MVGSPATSDGSDGVRLEWAGDLDIASASVLSTALAVLADLGSRRVVLDLSGVAFMDCAGLGALLDADTRLPGGLVLVGPSAPVRRLLGLTGLTDRFATSTASGRGTSLSETATTIERAKGLVMGGFGCTSDQASKMLLSTALRRNVQVQVLAALLVVVTSPEHDRVLCDPRRAVQRVMGLSVAEV